MAVEGEQVNLNIDDFWLYGQRGSQSRVLRFMRTHGRMFERGTPQRRRGGWYRAQKGCFRNAYLNVSTDPARYLYCEGFCWSSSHGPIQHAWFIDCQQPKVALDTTLKQDGKYQYFGIAIAWKYVCRAVLAENVHVSLLDYWERKHLEKTRANQC